jgi:hypothetical protein
MSSVLCALPCCAIRNRHLPSCPGWEKCWGCQPARAADGLNLCERDLDRIPEHATRAAKVYADLAQTLIRRGNGGESRGSSSGAPIPDEDVSAARAQIRETLLGLARRICRERGVSMPGARVAMGATIIRTRFDGSTVTDEDGNVMTRTAVRPSTPMEPLAAFVGTHKRWIAALPDAGAVAEQLRELARPGSDAWRLAYPSSTSRLYIGDCPWLVTDLDGVESVCATRLYWDGEAPLIRCEGCETDETIEQWQRWIVGEHGGEVDNFAAAADLSLRWSRPVDPSLLRKWAQRARLAGREIMVLELDPADPVGVKMRPRRDEKRRVLYDLAAVWDEARRIWGDQPQVGRRVA